MKLFMVTGGGQILLVRAKEEKQAEEFARKRINSTAGIAGPVRGVRVQELDVDGPEGVVVKLVPREVPAEA